MFLPRHLLRPSFYFNANFSSNIASRTPLAFINHVASKIYERTQQSDSYGRSYQGSNTAMAEEMHGDVKFKVKKVVALMFYVNRISSEFIELGDIKLLTLFINEYCFNTLYMFQYQS